MIASSRAIWVSTRITSAPPSASAVICSARASYISDSPTPSGSGSIISPVGPTERSHEMGVRRLLTRGVLGGESIELA